MPRVKKFDERETLQQAMEIFWKKGFHATSIQDLVDGLGIKIASIYHTFGDKEQLFIRAFNHYRLSSFDGVKEFLYGFESVKEGLMAMFELAIDESRSFPNENSVVLPARQQYSHSASVGSRNRRPAGSRPAFRSRSVIFVQNSTASSQVKFSTGFRGPSPSAPK